MSRRLSTQDRAIIARNIQRGIPLHFEANCWDIRESTALRIAGLSREESKARTEARVERLRR